MANYPFKINIQYKNGTTLPHYTSSFATDAETSLSASAMVDKINLIPVGNAYTQDNAPTAMHPSRKFGDANEGSKFISASYAHPNTGSVIFTDTEDTDNDGLDYYTFWGTKVCNVLGLPEGIPIYTETFKLSDDSSNPSNYLSGDVIADGVAIKESFKIAPQGRMRSNLVWDHQFGEGFLQWVSGSASKLLFGYDDQADTFLLSSATTATFNISGVDDISATVGDFGKVETNTITDGTNVVILAGITVYDPDDYTSGQLLLNSTGFNHMHGALSINYTEGDAWDSNSTFSDYGLTIENRGGSNAVNTFAGIAFDVGTEDDSNSIAGAIAVLRDNTTVDQHDGNMIFATNDAGDNGLTERLRITHDGKVGIGDGPCSSPTAHLEVSGSTIFNTGGDDFDFRVESVDYANMLFVNAATNQVSINSDSTSSPFEGDADRDFKHDSPFTVFATGELGGTTNDTVGMATFGYENSVSNGSYLEFFGRRNATGTGWDTAGTRIQAVVDTVGQGYIEFNGEAGDYGLSLGTSASGTSVGAYISSPGIILDGDGAVTKPRQPLFSYFNQTTDTNVADPYTVDFNTENFDRGGDFASDTFTAPVAGIYQLGTAVRTAQLDASATYYNLRIITTLKTYTKLYDMAVIGVGDGHSSGYHTLEMNTLVEMDAGDTAYVSIDRSGGATQMDVIGNSSTPHTRFYGYLVA
mgnify:CR=1 FL=1